MKRINFHIWPDTLIQAKAKAKEKRMTLAAFIRIAIVEKLNKKDEN